ncbi:VPS16-like protein [Mya arenaria]|uniref:Vacuolar protein sorting-associated protein 16 homolog n=1 Tax=Mya arenaria TaxID=6604 RepID=A0ABY7E4P2_MYAAR|nr:VPS16-like protein [Mya arenaria]
MASANWQTLGRVYYEKMEMYALEWGDQIDLSKFIVAAAPYGGPLALLQDISSNPNIGTTVRPLLTVFTSAGKMISQMRWNSGRIKQLGWSHNEELLCVQDEGTVLVYDIFLTFIRQFGMGQEAKETKVLDVRIFNSYKGTGIAILTCSFRVFIVNSIDDLRIRRLAEVPGLDSAPTAWGIITMDGQSQALVAKGNELYLIDHGGQYQKQEIEISTPLEAIIDMAISFNNKYIALFTESGLVWIGSADLKKKYCEFNTKSPQKPTQFVWSGPGAVVAMWEKMMLVIGPDKDYIPFHHDSTVSLVEEEDGIRIIGRDSVEFFRKVPQVTEQIFKIASMEPGAMLYEASREFERQSQRADEYIRTVKDQLDVAVSQCIQAAGHEFEPSRQSALLKAATFGKCFLTDYNPEPFVNMCQMLRVLNQVRKPSIGIPLTYTQLERLTMPVLIDRLVMRKYFYLAIRICQYLKLPEAEGASRILAHWACYKVQQKNEDDEHLARVIADKMGDTPGVSYSEIANKALEVGRPDLAIRLLDYEPKASRQDSMIQGEFFMAIRNIPEACSLFLQYCRQQNPQMMEQLYYQEDNFQEEATCKVVNSFKQEQVDEEIRLLKYQRRLEEELHREYTDLSLHETIHKLIIDNSHKMAETLRKEFKAFVDVCMKQNNKLEARKYVQRVTPDKKVACLIKVGLLREAADVAFQNRSEDELNRVLRKCSVTDRAVEDQVKGYRQQLATAGKR